MNRYYKILGVGLLACLMSCSEEGIIEEQSHGKIITATAVSTGSTSVFSRLGFEDKKDGEGGVGITWADGDKFDVVGTNASTEMAITSGQGEKTAQFTGVLTGTLTDGESVNAYYPATAYDVENTRFDVDFRTITQDCTVGREMDHLSATYLMTGNGTHSEGNIAVSFVGGTKVAMLRFDLTLPQQTTSGLTIDELQIVCEDLNTVGTLSADGEFTSTVADESHRQKVVLTNLSASTTADTQFSVYVNVLPVTITGSMRLKAMLSDETVYWCDVDLTDVELKANNRYYLVRAFLETQKVGVDYSWYDKNATPLTINDEAQLRAFAKIVNGNAPSISYDRFYEQTITLANDIELKVDWTPIGDLSTINYYFRGTFDGRGHKISNLFYHDFDNDHVGTVGFFGATDGATIKNLTIQGNVKSEKTCVGGIIGRNKYDNKQYSVIENCRSEVNVVSLGQYVGGIVSFAKNATIVNCSNNGRIENLKSSEVNVGGIVGYTKYTSIINCSNTARIEGLNTSSGYIGGIVSEFHSSEEDIVMACSNEGTIGTRDLSDIYIGGIAGRYATDSSTGGVGYAVANYNLANPLVDGDIENRKVAGLVADSYIKYYPVYLDVYGCYSLYPAIYQSSYSDPSKILFCDESVLALTADDKNAQANADILNAGIYKWNTNGNEVCFGKTEGVNGDTEDIRYCNYHFEVGTTHLVLKDGAPSAPADSGTEGGQ